MGAGDGSPPAGGKGSQPLDAESGPVVSPALLGGSEGDAGEAASDRIAELERELAALRRELATARAEAERAARRASIERALAAAGAIDLEVATPLVEAELSGMDEPDVAEAVRGVRSSKGFLFRASPRGGPASGSMAAERAGGPSAIGDLAGDARASGDRGDLLRYLRARRG